MVHKQEFTVGLLLVALLLSGVVYVTLGDEVRFRVDEDKATMYVHPESRWLVGGREYTRMFDGSKIMNRDKSTITINTTMDNASGTVTIVRQTGYQRGPVVRETWFFDGTVSDKEHFPISHTVEIFNGMGYFYRYTVDDLTDVPPKVKLDGELSLSFGRKMKVDLHPNYRWAWIGWPYGSDSLSAQYDITSDYEVLNFRLYDPEWSPDAVSTIRSLLETWEDAPAGDIDTDFWEYWRSDVTYGRYRVTGTGTPHGGSYHLLLDVTDSIHENRNKMMTKEGLFTGAVEMYLKVWIKESGEEDDQCPESWSGEDPGESAGDCVAFTCDGTEWFRIIDLTAEAYGSYTEVEVDIGADDDWCVEAASTFQISFGQDDNYPLSSDGVMYDDINITADFTEPPPPGGSNGCGEDPGIYIDGITGSVDIEYESNVSVCAVASAEIESVCITADHGEIREDFSCGLNTTNFNWSARHNIMRFNDTTSEKELNFSGDTGGVVNFTLKDMRNSSIIEFFKLDLAGELIYNYHLTEEKIHHDESGSLCGGSWDGTYTCENTHDEDYDTYGYGDEGSWANVWLNYSCSNCTDTITATTLQVRWYETVQAVYTNYTLEDYDCEVDPVQLNISLFESIGTDDYFIIECIDKDDPIGWNDIQRRETPDGLQFQRFYESSVFFNDTPVNWTKNVKFDVLDDLVYEWSMWGHLRETDIYTDEFNDNATSSPVFFNESGNRAGYLKLPTHTNVSIAGFTFTGVQNTYLSVDQPVYSRDENNNRYLVAQPAAELQSNDTDYYYLFGGRGWSVGGYSDYPPANNRTLRVKRGGGIDTLEYKNETPWQMGYGGCAVYKNGSDAGFYVMGGYDPTGDVLNNEMYRYDPELNSWTVRATMPDELAWFGCEIIDDEIFIVGGWDGLSSLTDTTYKYTISTNTWSAALTAHPSNVAMGVFDKFNDTHIISTAGCLGTSCVTETATYFYDYAGDSWDGPESSVPNDVVSPGFGKVGDEYYIYGGLRWPTGVENVYDVYRYNDGSWDTMDTVLVSPTQTGYANCDELENHTWCFSNSYSFNWFEYELFHYPRDVSLIIGENLDYTFVRTGDFAEEINTTGDITTSINDDFLICTENAEGYCLIPLTFTNAGAGNITLYDLSIITPLDRVNLGIHNVECDTENCSVDVEVYSAAAGNLTISNMSVQILGTGHINFSSYDSDDDFHNMTANIYFSDWNYTLPDEVDYLEFIPSTHNSSYVEPFGQNNETPMLNITALNVGGKNMNWSAYLNETDSCVNLIFNTEWNATEGTTMNDAGWVTFVEDKSPSDYWGLWMWANFTTCDEDTWRIWYPEFFFRGCCVTCICDNTTG
jgi:Kelch motif protein